MRIAGKRFVVFATVLVLAAALCAPGVALASTTLSAGKAKGITLYADSATQNKATLGVKGQKASAGTWKSSNAKIATVKAGKVVAKKVGKATITATYGEKTYKAKVTVKKVAISKKSATVKAKGKLTLKLTGDTIKKVKVSKTGIVTVANKKTSAVATGKKAGTVDVILTSGKGKTYTCKVTVKASTVKVTGVSFLNDELVLKTGGKAFANPASMSPSNATNKAVVYVSTDDKVATVDSKGNVTAVAKGNAVIMAVAADGGKIATCKVEVTNADKIIQVGSLEELKAALKDIDLKQACDSIKLVITDKTADAQALLSYAKEYAKEHFGDKMSFELPELPTVTKEDLQNWKQAISDAMPALIERVSDISSNLPDLSSISSSLSGLSNISSSLSDLSTLTGVSKETLEVWKQAIIEALKAQS